MLDALHGYTLESLPENWSAYRSKDCLCELWCPSDWRFEQIIGRPKIFRPPFARYLTWKPRESYSIGNEFYVINSPLFDFSPIITMYGMAVPDNLKRSGTSTSKEKLNSILNLIKPMNTIGEENVLENVFNNIKKGYADKNMHQIEKEVGIFRGRRSLHIQFFYTKDNMLWQGILLYQILGKKLWYVDVTGEAEDMTQYRDLLKQVIANFRTFESRSDFSITYTTTSI